MARVPGSRRRRKGRSCQPSCRTDRRPGRAAATQRGRRGEAVAAPASGTPPSRALRNLSAAGMYPDRSGAIEQRGRQRQQLTRIRLRRQRSLPCRHGLACAWTRLSLGDSVRPAMRDSVWSRQWNWWTRAMTTWPMIRASSQPIRPWLALAGAISQGTASARPENTCARRSSPVRPYSRISATVGCRHQQVERGSPQRQHGQRDGGVARPPPPLAQRPSTGRISSARVAPTDLSLANSAVRSYVAG